MKKVVSYCLYGSDTKYFVGAIKNAVLASKYLPDWESRFYVQRDVEEALIQPLYSIDNVRVIRVDKPSDNTFTLARFLVFADPTVDVAVCRDTDARLSAREILAVEEWLNSGLSFHVMKDHPIGHSYPISAGMFGAKADALRNIDKAIDTYFSGAISLDFYGIDQKFLLEKVYPLVLNSCMYHSEHYICKTYGDSVQKSFPTPDRYPDNHIGAALDENDGYTYPVDINACVAKNGVNKYIYDFDLLGE